MTITLDAGAKEMVTKDGRAKVAWKDDAESRAHEVGTRDMEEEIEDEKPEMESVGSAGGGESESNPNG